MNGISEREPQPLTDGEAIDPELLRTTFRSPPGLPVFPPTRSTLLVGARGSGKTTLLKHTEANDTVCAIYVDLRTVFNEVSSDTGAAGLTLDQISAQDEGPIQDKAMALLMVDVSQKLASVLQANRDDSLIASLSHLWDHFPGGRHTELAWIYQNVPTFEPSRFRARPNVRDLIDYLERAHQIVRTTLKRRLLLLVDRAEEIPYPALIPVLQLLDQGRSFQTIAATRPGMLGLSTTQSFSLPRPGDHYDIYHLGSRPYSKEWQAFQRNVMAAWIPQTTSRLPPPALATVLKVSRDSLRCALEFTYNALDESGIFSAERFNNNILNSQGVLLAAANGASRRLGFDLGEITNEIRKKYRNYRLPVRIQVTQSPSDAPEQLSLLGNGPVAARISARHESFVRIGLRTWFFSTIDGESWSPIEVPRELEINPLFLWYPSVKWTDESKRK